MGGNSGQRSLGVAANFFLPTDACGQDVGVSRDRSARHYTLFLL